MEINKKTKRCVRCIHSENYPRIKFDSEGICNYCRFYEKFEHYDLDKLKNIFSKIKSKGKYNCLVPISGGLDSTYVLYLACKRFKLKPLAFNFDNGFQHPIARKNIKNIVKKLGCDLRVIRIDEEILRKMYLSFMKASVPEICGPCMAGIYSFMFKIAEEENINLIINGSSIRNQGSPPLDMFYVRDGLYFNDVIKRFAPEILEHNYCRLSLIDYFRYFFIKGIKIINLPDYLKDWDDKEIASTLRKELNWDFPKDKMHRFDCIMHPVMNYWVDQKFHWNPTEMKLAAQVRSNNISKKDALNILKKGIAKPRRSLKEVLKMLDITEEEFDNLIKTEPKTFLNYKNYYSFILKFKLPIKHLKNFGFIQEVIYEYYFTH